MHLQFKAARLSAFFSRFLVLCLIAAVMAGSVPPAHADLSDIPEYYKSNLWDFLQGRDFDWGGTFWNNVIGYAVGQECPSSPDKYHHGPRPASSHIGGRDENGSYRLLNCNYCGKQFKAYSSFGDSGQGFGGDFKKSYDKHVGTMKDEIGSSVLSSANTLLWSPGHDFTLLSTNSVGTQGVYCPHHEAGSTSFRVDFNCVDGSPNFFASPAEGKTSFTLNHHVFSYSGSAPVSGVYRLLAGPASALTFCQAYGSEQTRAYSYSESSAGTSYAKGAIISYTFAAPVLVSSSMSYITTFKSYYAQGYAPVYEVIPASELLPTIVQNYGAGSRVGSINGDYGIIGDNGQINRVDNQYIVNETDNSVYNPVTNTTNTVQSWNYDYSTRTYNVTYDNGITATITYGDENITINEGDTVYNIYYLTSGSSSTTPTPGPGDGSGSGSDSDSSGGSIWKKLGELIGTVLGGIIEVLEGVVSKLLDALISLAEMLRSGIVEVVTTVLSIFDEVPALFSGFLDFLSLMFPFIPPEIMTLLTFGIAAIVFIGIIKAIRK